MEAVTSTSQDVGSSVTLNFEVGDDSFESTGRSLVRAFLDLIGEDAIRPGLIETPKRVVKSWDELFSGYRKNPAEVFTTFEEPGCDELVILKDIEFVSHCEHHLMAFSGVAHIGYIPKRGRVVGVSKLARLLDVYTRRLQIQERIGLQVTQALMKYLKPGGCGCVLVAKHSCISCRGVGKQRSTMITSSMRGSFRKHSVREEFLKVVGL